MGDGGLFQVPGCAVWACPHLSNPYLEGSVTVDGCDVLVGVHPRLVKNDGDANVGGQPLATFVTGSTQEFSHHLMLFKTPSL